MASTLSRSVCCRSMPNNATGPRRYLRGSLNWVSSEVRRGNGPSQSSDLCFSLHLPLPVTLPLPPYSREYRGWSRRARGGQL